MTIQLAIVPRPRPVPRPTRTSRSGCRSPAPATRQRRHASQRWSDELVTGERLPPRPGVPIGLRQPGVRDHAPAPQDHGRGAAGDVAGLAGRQRDLGARHLALAGVAPQLGDGLGRVVEPVDVALGQVAAVGVDRQRAAEAGVPVGDEAGRLALRAEAVVLELEEHQRGERVVELGDVDLLRARARPSRTAGARRRPRRSCRDRRGGWRTGCDRRRYAAPLISTGGRAEVAGPLGAS